jgi:hypothetical protein
MYIGDIVQEVCDAARKNTDVLCAWQIEIGFA